MLKSVLDYLETSESLYNTKKAVIDETGYYTYGQLAHEARSVGTYLLKNRVGKKPGIDNNDVVVVLMDKSRVALAAFWGITYAAGIYAPMDCGAPSSRLKLILNVLKPVAILTDEEHLEEALELTEAENIILIEKAMQTQPDIKLLEDIQIQRIDSDPLYIICTSGSTGVPKGVVISHRAVIDFTEEASETMGFSETEIFVNQAPFYFDASVPDLYCTIRNGATLHIIPESWFAFPIKVLEYIKSNGVNAIFWVPSALIVTANLKALREVDVTCLKKIMFCGEVMPVKQYNMWKKYVPDAIYVNYYGPSETTYASTYYRIDREFKNDDTLPIGRAANNTGVLILNEDDKKCEVGETGELCIRGSGVALGYYNNPQKTEEAFVQNPLNPYYRDTMYRTGDLVRVNDFGELEYVGRKDFQIKHMGYRIELGEIEAACTAHMGIERVCCVYRDNKIVLFYEGDVLENDIKEFISHKLPEYMLPQLYICLDEIPMSPNGKIDRNYLKDYMR
jgi:amino acid adenylation domain-containing protein